MPAHAYACYMSRGGGSAIIQQLKTKNYVLSVMIKRGLLYVLLVFFYS